jgi:hypothetical protein
VTVEGEVYVIIKSRIENTNVAYTVVDISMKFWNQNTNVADTVVDISMKFWNHLKTEQ